MPDDVITRGVEWLNSTIRLAGSGEVVIVADQLLFVRGAGGAVRQLLSRLTLLKERATGEKHS